MYCFSRHSISKRLLQTIELIQLAVFEGNLIRKILQEGEWWFAVIDIVEVLTGSSIPKRYWSDLKRKLAKEGYSELYEKIVQLKFAAADGKFYSTDCANTETMFRIIQSMGLDEYDPTSAGGRLLRSGKSVIFWPNSFDFMSTCRV
jgi:hypothetical protein